LPASIWTARAGSLADLDIQEIQCGTTTIILEIDYTDIHSVAFHIKESLGTRTECTRFWTNFKDSDYYNNLDAAMASVEQETMELGLCYKLVDIDWCVQIHHDP